ncbi:MAG: xanthine dehydrogenase family protein subunit M, partial [Candidatus Brockarchaeota archaeon]|nr:xanthine dehydrogenase family protein subunit M [Candidatus Brockarchaeota archaeon]
MKPLPSFLIHRPRTVNEALKMLSELEKAKPIAGGTDLLPLLRDRVVEAKNLIDISLIPELRGIKEGRNEIRIGAATKIKDVEKSRIIFEKAPVLCDAASSIGSPQIRNLGTIGGNICNASPAADSAPSLLVLDAYAEVVSSKGSREIPVKEVFKGPKRNSLRPDELLISIKFPEPFDTSTMSFQKLGRRRGYTIAQVNVAVLLEFDGPVCCDAKISVGAAASTPIRIYEAEERLWNKRLTEEIIEDASTQCMRAVDPIDDVRASAEYRREMSHVLVRRCLMEAWNKA